MARMCYVLTLKDNKNFTVEGVYSSFEDAVEEAIELAKDYDIEIDKDSFAIAYGNNKTYGFKLSDKAGITIYATSNRTKDSY